MNSKPLNLAWIGLLLGALVVCGPDGIAPLSDRGSNEGEAAPVNDGPGEEEVESGGEEEVESGG